MQTRSGATRRGAARDPLAPAAALRLLAAACLLPPAYMLAAQIANERTRYSVLTSAAVSVLGFFGTLRLIPVTRAYTLKAGLFGLDINKKGSKEGEKRVPESLGLASGVVFLVRCGAVLGGAPWLSQCAGCGSPCCAVLVPAAAARRRASLLPCHAPCPGPAALPPCRSASCCSSSCTITTSPPWWRPCGRAAGPPRWAAARRRASPSATRGA